MRTPLLIALMPCLNLPHRSADIGNPMAETDAKCWMN